MSRTQCPECHCQCGYSDQPLHLRPQKPRTTFTQGQLATLEIAFKETCYPGTKKRSIIAQATQLPVDRIRVWFQNRRAKEKRLKEDQLALSARLDCKINLNKNEIYKNPLEEDNFFAPAARIQPVLVEPPPQSEEEIIRLLLKRAKEKHRAKQQEYDSSEQQNHLPPSLKKRGKKRE